LSNIFLKNGTLTEKIKGNEHFVFYGSKDDDVLYPDLQPGLVRSNKLPGGHRIGSHGRIIVGQTFKFLHQNK
jgi:hypothetical protein